MCLGSANVSTRWKSTLVLVTGVFETLKKNNIAETVVVGTGATTPRWGTDEVKVLLDYLKLNDSRVYAISLKGVCINQTIVDGLLYDGLEHTRVGFVEFDKGTNRKLYDLEDSVLVQNRNKPIPWETERRYYDETLARIPPWTNKNNKSKGGLSLRGMHAVEPAFCVKRSTIPEIGQGLFAAKDFVGKEVIRLGPYGTQQITEDDFRTMTDEQSSYVMTLENSGTILNNDPNNGGNIMGYINHSDDKTKQNCEFVEQVDKCAVFTTKNVTKGTEFFTDYGSNYWSNHTLEQKK